MAPPPPDSPQTELAPRKRRRKREDPQSCITNSEVRSFFPIAVPFNSFLISKSTDVHCPTHMTHELKV